MLQQARATALATDRWAARGERGRTSRAGVEALAMIDHTGPLAVSSSVRAPVVPVDEPEPDPSCVKIHAPQRQQPINALHMGPAVQHAAAINSHLPASRAASPDALSALDPAPCWFPSALRPVHLLVSLRGSSARAPTSMHARPCPCQRAAIITPSNIHCHLCASICPRLSSAPKRAKQRGSPRMGVDERCDVDAHWMTR
jgi:hypothetical protein